MPLPFPTNQRKQKNPIQKNKDPHPRVAIKSVVIGLEIDLEMKNLERIDEIVTVTASVDALRKREMEGLAMAMAIENEILRDEGARRNEKAEIDLDLPSVTEAQEEAETIIITANIETENIHDTNEIENAATTTTIFATQSDAPVTIVITTMTGDPEDHHQPCSAEEVTLVATQI